MDEIDCMDMPGFLKMRAWNAKQNDFSIRDFCSQHIVGLKTGVFQEFF